MIMHLFQSALILTLFYMTYRVFFARFTFFQHNRFFLLGGVAMSLLLPFLPLNFSKERTEYVYLSKSYFENTLPATADELPSNVFWQNWSVIDWLTVIYFSGMVLFAIIMVVQILQVKFIIRDGSLIRRDGMKLVLTEKTTSPFSFFNTIVMNPKMLSEEQLGHIVTHENIHISQWHQLDVVVAEILKMTLWFFPVSWWYGKSIRTNLEFIADTNSLENGLDKKSYQLNLVSISQQPSGPVLVNNFSKKLIKNRIKMLNKMKTKKQILSFYALLIPVLMLVSIGISVKAQSQNEKVKQVIVLSDEKIEPEDIRIQIKNENGEFKDVDSVNLKMVEAPKFSEGSALIMRFDSEFKKSFDTKDFDHINPQDISTIDVRKNGENEQIIIVYKGNRKSDTILSSNSRTFSYTFNDAGSVISPKELKMKVQKGDFDLDKPENQWMKQWKKNDFKEPIDYHELQNGDGVYKVRRIEINPQSGEIYKAFKTDTIEFKNYYTLPKGAVVFPEGVGVYRKENQTFPILREFKFLDNIGNKKPLVIIDGKVSSLKKIRKLEGNKDYDILYLKSDAMIRKFGNKAKDGVLIAKKKNKSLEDTLK